MARITQKTTRSAAPPLSSALFLAFTLTLAQPSVARAQTKSTAPAAAQKAGPGEQAGQIQAGQIQAGKAKNAGSEETTAQDATTPTKEGDEPRSTLPDSPERRARVLYQKGNAAFKRGDSILARSYYRKSLQLHESFDTVCNLGRAQAKDKLFPEAYFHLSWCAYLYPRDKELADARAKFVRLRDDVRIELTPVQQEEIDARIDEKIEYRLATAHPPKSGLEGLTEEESTPPVTTVKRRGKAALPVSVTLGVLGVAGLGVGAGFLVASEAKKGDIEDLSADLSANATNCSQTSSDDCKELSNLAKDKDRLGNIGTGSLIAGGALAVGAVVTYALWPRKEVPVTSARLRDIRPTVGASEAGGWTVGLRGKF